ncbi:MAG: hypothetical protein SGJ13_14155 [Actinomycetota bacterium]|nr:hypothetical protein [Actinomycetota bacterium]
MNEALLFGIGSVVFIAVSAAVFLYGLLWFRTREELDDRAAAQLAVIPLVDRRVARLVARPAVGERPVA